MTSPKSTSALSPSEMKCENPMPRLLAQSSMAVASAPDCVTKASLPVGAEIKVFGYQAKSGESKGVGVFVEYLDGRKVFMGGSAPGANGRESTPNP